MTQRFCAPIVPTDCPAAQPASLLQPTFGFTIWKLSCLVSSPLYAPPWMGYQEDRLLCTEPQSFWKKKCRRCSRGDERGRALTVIEGEGQNMHAECGKREWWIVEQEEERPWERILLPQKGEKRSFICRENQNHWKQRFILLGPGSVWHLLCVLWGQVKLGDANTGAFPMEKKKEEEGKKGPREGRREKGEALGDGATEQR